MYRGLWVCHRLPDGSGKAGPASAVCASEESVCVPAGGNGKLPFAAFDTAGSDRTLSDGPFRYRCGSGQQALPLGHLSVVAGPLWNTACDVRSSAAYSAVVSIYEFMEGAKAAKGVKRDAFLLCSDDISDLLSASGCGGHLLSDIWDLYGAGTGSLARGTGISAVRRLKCVLPIC